jgi:ABC-type multidrug transport system ATPase subunit
VHHLESADQILVLDDGDLIAKGTSKQLMDIGINLKTYLSENLNVETKKRKNSKKGDKVESGKSSSATNETDKFLTHSELSSLANFDVNTRLFSLR